MTMPYAQPQDRLAAKRRYNASPKGKATRRRYYEQRKCEPVSWAIRPLAEALSHWRN